MLCQGRLISAQQSLRCRITLFFTSVNAIVQVSQTAQNIQSSSSALQSASRVPESWDEKSPAIAKVEICRCPKKKENNSPNASQLAMPMAMPLSKRSAIAIKDEDARTFFWGHPTSNPWQRSSPPPAWILRLSNWKLHSFIEV